MSVDAKNIYWFVKKIPKGKVASYGMIAALAGVKSARLVGRYLHQNPDPASIPCHRVVYQDGRLSEAFAFGGAKEQRLLLKKEGVVFKTDRVDMALCAWK